MIVYRSEKNAFLRDVRRGDIDEVILEQFKAATGRSVARAEQRSWGNSLQHVANVLDDASVPEYEGKITDSMGHSSETERRHYRSLSFSADEIQDIWKYVDGFVPDKRRPVVKPVTEESVEK